MRNYYDYRNETSDKPVKRFTAYVKEVMTESRNYTTEEYIGMIARNFNYVSMTDDQYFTSIALPFRTKYKWRKIASSNFKRNRDWRLNEGNFIKSEVLKLRRQMEEGTFDE